MKTLMALTGTSGKAVGSILEKDKSTVSRKLKTGAWTVEDLDRLGEHFGVSVDRFFVDPGSHFGLPTPNSAWIFGKPEQLDLFASATGSLIDLAAGRELAECA